jgi:hypothetical protein
MVGRLYAWVRLRVNLSTWVTVLIKGDWIRVGATRVELGRWQRGGVKIVKMDSCTGIRRKILRILNWSPRWHLSWDSCECIWYTLELKGGRLIQGSTSPSPRGRTKLGFWAVYVSRPVDIVLVGWSDVMVQLYEFLACQVSDSDWVVYELCMSMWVVYEYVSCVWVCELCMRMWVCEFMSMWVCEYVSMWVCEYVSMCVWVCEYVSMWVCELCMSMWVVYEYVSMWVVYEYVYG